MISLKPIKLKPAQLSIEQINTYINQSNTMTIEEANKLIEGEIYIASHGPITFKRRFNERMQMLDHNSQSQTYLIFSYVENPKETRAYLMNEVEVIGVYNSELTQAYEHIKELQDKIDRLKDALTEFMDENPHARSCFYP